MPNESLPYKQPQEGNLLSPQSNIFGNSNLLGNRELFKAEVDIRRTILRFYKYIIFILCTVTLILVYYNKYLSSEIEKLNTSKDQLIYKFSDTQSTLGTARELQDQINSYKKILISRKKLSVPFEKVYSITNENMQLLSFVGKPESFTVIARSTDATSIVKVLYGLLSSGEIKQLVLKSVELDSATNIYRVSFTGVFK